MNHVDYFPLFYSVFPPKSVSIYFRPIQILGPAYLILLEFTIAAI